MSGLTPKQFTAFTFIANHIHEHGVAPSFEEIGAALSTAKSGVHRIVHGLIERGYLRKDPKRRRSLTIVKAPKAYTAPLPTAAVLQRLSAADLDELRRAVAFEYTRRANNVAIARAGALLGAAQ